jgi:preprotein translocase SecE subunit
MNKIGQIAAATKGFVGEVQAELKKCAWPTRPELFESTVVVMFAVLIITAAVGVSDLVLLNVMNLVMR